MIEFSLILTVLIGLFVGAFEIMTLYGKRSDLEAATRLGARQASETWVENVYINSATNDGDANFETAITEYVHDQMALMSYDKDWMGGVNSVDRSDDNVKVTVTAWEFDNTGNTLVLKSPPSKICTYGDYIKVEIDMNWSFAVLPLNALISNGAPSAGVMHEELLLRCWRGN